MCKAHILCLCAGVIAGWDLSSRRTSCPLSIQGNIQLKGESKQNSLNSTVHTHTHTGKGRRGSEYSSFLTLTENDLKCFSDGNLDRNLFLWWKLVSWRNSLSDRNYCLTETYFCNIKKFCNRNLILSQNPLLQQLVSVTQKSLLFCYSNLFMWQKPVLLKIPFFGRFIRDFNGKFSHEKWMFPLSWITKITILCSNNTYMSYLQMLKPRKYTSPTTHWWHCVCKAHILCRCAGVIAGWDLSSRRTSCPLSIQGNIQLKLQSQQNSLNTTLTSIQKRQKKLRAQLFSHTQI